MDTNIIVRGEHKNQIAVFNKETRLAIDEAIVSYNSLIEKTGKEAAAMARKQAIAVSMMAEDKDALEKAGFDTFKDAAAALVHLAPSNATQYRKAGDFIRSKDAPAIVNWYSPSALYEFTAKKVPVDIINKDIQSGALKEDMPFSAIRAWCEANSPKALTDGEEKPEIAKLFDAEISVSARASTGRNCYITFTMFSATEDEIKRRMALSIGGFIFDDSITFDDGDAFGDDASMYANGMPDTMYGRFDPQSEFDDGKRKVKCKGIFLAPIEGMAKAIYHATGRSKKTPDAKTVDAQNATIEKLMARIAELEAKQA